MAQHHNEDIEGENGFWFRRIYMTYSRDLNEAFSTRIRLEMNSAGDFQSGTEMIPNVKDAYLKWENENHQILAGISGSPLFGLSEDVWGYRSVEKSPQDLYDFGSSRDFGLAFKGQLGQAGNLTYHLFVGNGNGNKPDVDKGKKVSLALGYYLTEHFVIEGYGDVNSKTNDPNSYTAQLFSGYQSEKINIGALYSNQYEEGQLGLAARSLDLVSVFANFKISDKTKGFLRADHLFGGYMGGSENSYIPFSEDVESTFMVAGADFFLSDQVHLMPNIETIVYGENNQGISPDTDIIPRLTLFWNF
ncbi:hypothetical protein CK503_00615 [Aliifodinibius salipaludis]|uniref:Alginate export domain-containing protein n=2 Tax=Fodinibius salipaludis TaxID=2032627 RepID=A0A2A2GDI1_9BACT|nr:hypothetical protein CK503_00615 [Aliifodinibius salipaludis]